jgi:hypothetical protein
MSIFLTAVKDGTVKGIKTGLMLLKIMLPIYFIVVLIKYSPIMPWFQNAFEPSMGLFRLPGNAIIPIITGVFTDEYGVIAAMRSFDFSMAQITTIAMVILTVHSLPVESAIAQKIGFPPIKLAIFRITLAIFIGFLVGWIGGIL